MKFSGIFLLAFLMHFGSARSQVNLSLGLEAYYPFSGHFNDVSGNGHHGTPFGGMSFGPDHLGNPNSAALFDGVDDYINVPGGAGMTPTHEFSMSFRFRSTSTALQMLFSKSEHTGVNVLYPNGFQYQVAINSASTISNNSFVFATDHNNNCATTAQFASSYVYGTETPISQWFCVVLTFDNGVKKVYMNGSLISTTTLSAVANLTSIDSCPTGNFRIGLWWPNDARWFKGTIDEVRLWNRGLNAQEAEALCGILPEPPGGCFGIINLPDTVSNCRGNTVSLNPSVSFTNGPTTTFDTTWTPATGLSDPNIINPGVTVGATGLWYKLTVLGFSTQNLIANGNFSSGNIGYSSGYTYGTNGPNGPITGAGEYSVSPNAAIANNTFASFPDHTGNPGGLMLVANGHPVANTPVWCQTITVQPNTNYRLSAWAAAASAQNPSKLQFAVNGVPLGVPTDLPAVPGGWVNIQQVWNSGNSTGVTFCIRETTGLSAGNDFAIDDITVHGGCSASDSVFVKPVAFPSAIGFVNKPGCNTDTVQFTANNPAGVPSFYNWDFGDGSSSSASAGPTHIYQQHGSYTIRLITVVNGCRDTSYAIFTHQPVVDAGTDSFTICAGTGVLLNASGAVSYQWMPATGLTCTTCTSPFASPASTTIYNLIGTHANGCKDSDKVIVNVVPRLPVSVSRDTSLCPGTSTQLLANGGATYLWSPAEGLSCTACASPIASPANSTEYKVVIMQDTCYTDTLSVRVTLRPTPQVDAGDDQYMQSGNPLTIFASSDGKQFAWSPADGLSCTNCLQPVAAPGQTTTYTLTAVNEWGCEAKDQVTLFVSCQNLIWLPNTFTPNGDGHNDMFYVHGKGLTQIRSLRIYNRWGELMINRINMPVNDPQVGWDGSWKGVRLKPDTYVYVIDAICPSTGEAIMVKGNVSLLR